MTPIEQIDPLGDTIAPARALEIGSLVESLARHASFTIKEERAVERLVTRAYLAGFEDGGVGANDPHPTGDSSHA